MSRTDKTDPLIVRLWHGDLTREACHDHRAESTCDLPASLKEDLDASCTRCTWEFRWTGIRCCCCGMCRAQARYRRLLRGIRTADKARLARGAKAWRVGDATAFDDIVPALRYRP
ncbi:hypothetical protein FLW53_14020 [Microbispora sp. SCL1-1]|jgi:hypothetical protein|uniref:Uncharacterized protein n=1 Tax=Microbispora hainanensis TaxID=568844 RepID=A0ABZ1SVP5_9ACTN|nr:MULTISPECIES: hypothetical protein [Microbispora]NJP25290.1 hypothetical protein [Microbispora sp. CL1-1]TQS13738.1 hypothetical protein FLW53_14020 [Microbispora sp. SCL1-1]